MNEQTNEQKMQLKEEQVDYQKEDVQAGEVRLAKDVVTEQKTTEVPVKHEEVVVERHAVDGGQPAGEIGADEVTVPVYREEAHAEVTPVVKEEVTVGKRQIEEIQPVSTEVRHEEVRVENAGEVERRS